MAQNQGRRSLLEGAKQWWVFNRFVIYLIGLILWIGLSIWLPISSTAARVGQPPSPIQGVVEYLLEFIGALLLALNLISTAFRRDEYQKLAEEGVTTEDIYDKEVKRMDLIQDYGAKVILPASLATAFVAGRISALFLAYMVAAIAAGAGALVPIWVSGLHYQPLTILRHIKTVIVIWAAIWLVQAVATLL
jgi:hypothetical protein